MSTTHQRFERTLAWHCAPSMAGIKAADLLAWNPPEEHWGPMLGHYIRILSLRGIRLRVLGQCRRQVLLLIFRPARLEQWLKRPDVSAMLAREGYPVVHGIEAMLAHLRRRIRGGPFPHEIGLFLGYPPADVAGFLRDGGRGCKLSGAWKVYEDVEGAARRFASFRRCRDALTLRLEEGSTLAQVFPLSFPA